MARGQAKISAAYRRRVEKALGVTYEEAKAQGLSLQAARGHRPREKAELEQRRRERGQLSDRERRFFNDQVKKEASWRSPDEQLRRKLKARAAFEKMTPVQRETLMRTQRRLAFEYRINKAARRRAKRGGKGRSRPAGPVTVGGGGGPLGSDYGFGAGGGFHGGGSYYVGSGSDDFDDWYEDEWPDLDEDSDLLLFYH